MARRRVPDRRHRIRIFVDFWNYTLLMRSIEAEFRTDWSQLGPALASAAVEKVEGGAAADYQGLNLYGSFDPRSEKDRNMHRWATGVVARFPGVRVSIVPRPKKRSPPKCPHCHEEVPVCPVCGNDMRGTEEKGVDVRIATDMISLAWDGSYDVAVLVSSDRDFVPLAEFLATRGIKVIHGRFPPQGADLAGKCWGEIGIPELRENFRRAPGER